MSTLNTNDIAIIIQSALSPVIAEMQSLKGEVHGLAIDRVTRSDFEKLRSEIVASFVPRDAYEPRHSSLIDRDIQLETAIREERKEREADVQKVIDRLESGKQQLEDRMKQAQDVDISAKDRAWIRWTQVLGASAIVFSIVISLLGFTLQHIHFN